MNKLHNIHNYINRKRKGTLDSINLEKDLKWLDELYEPSDYLEASYAQYCCQNKYVGKVEFYFREILSILLLAYLYVRKSHIISEESKYNIVFNLEDENHVPVLTDLYFPQDFEKFNLTRKERTSILNELKKYKGNFYFKAKILFKCGLYGFYIKKYKPSVIYCSSEYSFTSSYLTKFCHQYNVKHINVQHGEELINLYSTFFWFDKMYVWDERYIELAKQMRSKTEKFEVFFPAFLRIDVSKYKEKFYCKYYLQNQDETTMEKIFELMDELKNRYKVQVRMHPRYPNRRLENKYADLIEKKGVSIEESIGETKYVISLYSTVLLQAKESGKQIIIDDVTAPEKYSNLVKAGYVMIRNNEMKLSEFILGNGD